MAFDESSDAGEQLAAALDEARRLLKSPEAADPVWPALAAAAFFAICAMVLATTAILAPPPRLPASPPAANVDAAPHLRGPA